MSCALLKVMCTVMHQAVRRLCQEAIRPLEAPLRSSTLHLCLAPGPQNGVAAGCDNYGHYDNYDSAIQGYYLMVFK